MEHGIIKIALFCEVYKIGLMVGNIIIQFYGKAPKTCS